MVRVLVGDMFHSDAQTLVNTVNCVGVMGKGVALQFKKRFPEMHADYVERCRLRRVRLGYPYLYRSLTPPWVLNFPTKDHWRSVTKLQDIVDGLEYLEQHYLEWGIASLAVPPLGCGEGQLEWRVVGPTLYEHLRHLELPVELYAPYGTSADELELGFFEREARLTAVASASPPRVQAGWVALVEILAQIEHEPYHWPVGRVTFQKLAYFATAFGIPTGLTHRRSSFGPYAADLKKIATRLVNNGLISEEPLGRMLAVRVGQTFPDARRAYERELEEWSAPSARVADLLMRMRTDQAEIAATVHFAANEVARRAGSRPTESDVLREVMTWKQRRRPPLDEKDVALAIRNLGALRVIDVVPSADLPIEDELLVDA